jgi:hypothetical protein
MMGVGPRRADPMSNFWEFSTLIIHEEEKDAIPIINL